MKRFSSASTKNVNPDRHFHRCAMLLRAERTINVRLARAPRAYCVSMLDFRRKLKTRALFDPVDNDFLSIGSGSSPDDWTSSSETIVNLSDEDGNPGSVVYMFGVPSLGGPKPRKRGTPNFEFGQCRNSNMLPRV